MFYIIVSPRVLYISVEYRCKDLTDYLSDYLDDWKLTGQMNSLMRYLAVRCMLIYDTMEYCKYDIHTVNIVIFSRHFVYVRMWTHNNSIVRTTLQTDGQELFDALGASYTLYFTRALECNMDIIGLVCMSRVVGESLHIMSCAHSLRTTVSNDTALILCFCNSVLK